MNMKSTDSKQRGILALFKNPDGGFHKWFYVFLVLAGLIAVIDVISLSGWGVNDSVYEREIRMVMQEFQGAGNSFLESGEVGDVSLNSNYEYVFEGPRIVHDYLASNIVSGRHMNQQLEAIDERTIDDVKMNELNDPKVVDELKIAYQKEILILTETFERDREELEKMMEAITELHKNSPDDKFVSGLYMAFVETKPVSFEIADEIMASTNALYASVEHYLDFLLANKGKYKFDQDGSFVASSTLVTSNREEIDKMKVATERLNEINAKYMETFSLKMSELEKVL